MDDLISEFITETSESLSVLDLELVKLEQNPEDDGILSNIFRIMHTIKGTCGFLGLPRLESVAHAAENVLGKIRDRKLEASPGAVSLVLESIDSIKDLIEYLSTNGEEPAGDDSALIGRLNHFADTGQIGEGDVSSSKMPAVEATAPAEQSSQDFSGYFKGDDELEAMIAALEAESKGAEVVLEQQSDEEMLSMVQDAPPPAAPVPTAAPAAPVAVPATAKPANAEPKASSGGGGDTNQSIRVNIDVLENLMQMVSELVLTRNQLIQIARTREDKDFMTPLQQLSHITTELQEGVMKTRMQPIGNAWSKFPRLIRDLSHELGKKIELKMHGAETELDRQLLEMIKDPLTHMVRNSCDHGLEMPAERLAAGKSEMGTVTLSAYHEGGHIIIEINDDGKGLNIDRIKEKILNNGLATEAELAALSDQQIGMYIFRAGFSTAEKITSVSGRGVGMDVVKTNIEKIGGTIDLSSVQGKGSKFSIKIPLTLAIVSVLIVEAMEQKFAIPQINVVEIVRAAPDSAYEVELINNTPVMRLREKLLPLAVLTEVLGGEYEHEKLVEQGAFVAVCKVGGYDFGLVVDRVYDTEEIVVKPVANIIKSISVYSGNTILGDGSVIMILDPNGLARTLGEVDISGAQDENDDAQNVDHASLVSFLLFDTDKDSPPKAVPLELVSRLEEIDMATVEDVGQTKVVQYRNDLMRLVSLDGGASLPEDGIAEVIVFTYDKKVVGLVVGEIKDIVHAPLAIQMNSKMKNCLGSMVINGHATEVVDVAALLTEVLGAQMPPESQLMMADQKPRRVLLVEDSPFFRNLTVPFISSAGHKVTAVENGLQALQLLNRDPNAFDLMVTDLEMPEMNGYELAQACQLSTDLQHLPMIAYTASMGGESAKKCKDVGIKECILKTDRPGLLQAINQCVILQKEAV